MKRHELDDGTVLTIQTPVGPPGTQAAAVAVLFDGRPMINAGVSGTLLTLQDEAIIPPLMLVAVESIEGSTPRGPTRCASLTNPSILGRFVGSLEGFFEHELDALPSQARRLVLGHSLGGNAALYVACHWPHLFGGVVTGSAALYWPGDDDQLAGRRVVEDVLTSRGCGSGCRPVRRRTPICSPPTGISGSVLTKRDSTLFTGSSRAGTTLGLSRSGSRWRCPTFCPGRRSAELSTQPPLRVTEAEICDAELAQLRDDEQSVVCREGQDVRDHRAVGQHLRLV